MGVESSIARFVSLSARWFFVAFSGSDDSTVLSDSPQLTLDTADLLAVVIKRHSGHGDHSKV